nr:MAG TPA: hypothetical protein [Herelleviridae sp.]
MKNPCSTSLAGTTGVSYLRDSIFSYQCRSERGIVLIGDPEIRRLHVVVDGSLGCNLSSRRSGSCELCGAVVGILLSNALGEAISGGLARLQHLNVRDDQLGGEVALTCAIDVGVSGDAVGDLDKVTLVDHVENAIVAVSGNEALDGYCVGATFAVAISEVLIDQNGEANGARTVRVVEEARVSCQAAKSDAVIASVDTSHCYSPLCVTRRSDDLDQYIFVCICDALR